MWKPGSAKPQGSNKKNAKGRTPNKRGRDNMKDGPPAQTPRKIDVDDGNDDNEGGSGGGDTPSALSAVAPVSQKKLSGSTMNMKFMTRKKETQAFARKNNQQQNNQQSPAAAQSPVATAAGAAATDDDPMQVDMDSSSAPAAMSPLVQQQHSYPNTSSRGGAIPIDMVPATTSDMYGISVDIVGRRSFGGFNRSVENTWKASYQSHQEDGANGSNGSNSKDTLSDEQLLARYANLAKNRGGGGNKEDMSRQAVGNLGDKVKPRKQMGGGAEKRKRG